MSTMVSARARDIPHFTIMARRIKARRGEMPWRDWLARYFPAFTTAPFADHHVEAWEWAGSLQQQTAHPAFIACWPRGGGKSTTIELICSWLGSQPNPVRHYVLYVCETQAQADRHVQAIAGLLERIGIARAVNEFGASKGWRRTEVRASNGFNVTAMGLDSAMRGAKLDEFRPDLIVFDDIDGRHDSATTTTKKIETITTSILPTGSTDAAVIVVQNMIHEHGIMAQMVDGTADFLHDRLPAEPIRAVDGLMYESHIQPDGTKRYRIVDGEATWTGQSIETCEKQINEWGLTAFLREAQHEVEANEDGILQRHWFSTYTVRPYDAVVVQSWDTAFKDGKTNDFSVCSTIAYTKAGRYILDVYRAKLQYPDLKRMASQIYAQWRPEAVLIEDKASGQSLLQDLKRETSIPAIAIDVPSIRNWKVQRVNDLSPMFEAGRVYFPEAAPWLEETIRELTIFPRVGEHDDIVDSIAQGLQWIEKRTMQPTTWGGSWLPDDDDDYRSEWQ